MYDNTIPETHWKNVIFIIVNTNDCQMVTPKHFILKNIINSVWHIY